ncbi:MAG: FkbM family methyltransferase [Vallitalea sp.]|nr:FkbM family methyltransferase [Vallitalea sp.]
MLGNQLKDVQIIFENIRSSNKPVILFGAGGQAALLLNILKDEGIQPTCFCDNNNKLWGKKYLGFNIYSYEDIKEKYDEYIIIISVRPIGADMVINQLEENNEKNQFLNMCVPFKVDYMLLNYNYIIQNIDKYQKVYNLLADTTSKDIFIDMLNYKITGDGISLVNKISGHTFFDDSIISKNDKHVYIDVGAYTGDTIMKFCQFNGNHYNKIIGIELEKVNFECLEKFVKYSRLQNVDLYNIGAWSQKESMTCYTFSNTKFQNANLYVKAEKVTNEKERTVIEEYKKQPTAIQMEVNSVDNILNGKYATLIKINALSADLEILKGCKKTISKCKPNIVLEYGCKPEHIIEIPLLLKEIQPSYKIFLKQKNIFGDSKTILYAV